MMPQSFATFLPGMIVGIGLMQFAWDSRRASALALKVFLGIGLGIGITSCLYFLRILFLPEQGGYLLIQILFLAVVLVVLFLQKKISLELSLNPIPLTRTQILFGLATIFVLLVTVYYSITFARLAPHGDYDAQAIWNLRARSIYRSGDAWRNAFSPLINRDFHMDYPLLIPLSVVGGWNTLGGEVLRVPAVLAMLFLFGLAGIIYATIAYLQSSSQAAIATIILLGTPSLLLYSTFQTADIPLAYFFVATVSLFILAKNENNPGLLFCSGMMAGLSAWTKNEGLSFALVILTCTSIVFGIRRRTYLLSLLVGMAFPLLSIGLFKILIPTGNDFVANNGLAAILSKLVSPTRYIQILNHLLAELFHLGGWPVSILIILIIYGWIMGRRASTSRVETFSFAIPFLQFAGYMFIYLITPNDLEWQINYSMSRLLIQLFPMLLLSFFLWINPPEMVLNAEALERVARKVSNLKVE